MINRQQLLADLQSILRNLEADLLDRTDSDEVPEVGEWLRAEYQKAKDAGRTAHTQKQWMDDFITQVAAAWVLSCVFVRFLEDNELVDPPRIAGPGNRLKQARDEHALFFQDSERAKLTNREYLLDIFEGLAKLPAGKDVFGPHNPMNALPNWLGPDAAGELLQFFQKIDADSGELVHDFTDPKWDTRFLGDLYQDLSEAARKKYALLQTPDFVEEFILDRTLDPALEEFGLTPESDPDRRFRMIDPACGSGHFLLGAFPRILDCWQKQAPGTNVRELVQRTLDSIHGVDVNPYAIAIARFRLWLAALNACGITQPKNAPAYELNLACGDSLWHAPLRVGSKVAKGQREFTEMSPEADHEGDRHTYFAEDAARITRLLRESQYHCVVANPPYIVPKDRALNQDYRNRYETCHMKYSLAVPFMERILRLAAQGRNVAASAGFTGQITANSFMKREFGRKLIESWFPSINLTHVIDTSGAYIPGHGTPTVILFARNQKPVADTIRTVMGIRGEPSTPDDPSSGLVWSAIVDQIDQPGSQSEFVSVDDSERERFNAHPWSLEGGGATKLSETLSSLCERTLQHFVESIGPASFTGFDDAFVAHRRCLRRRGIIETYIRPFAVGDGLRDWVLEIDDHAICPYGEHNEEIPLDQESQWYRFLWPNRQVLGSVKKFAGKTRFECGDNWWSWYRWIPERYRDNNLFCFAFLASHNHFIYSRRHLSLNHSAPLIKLPTTASEDMHYLLCGLLNTSIVCFLMKQMCHQKQMTGGDGIRLDSRAKVPFEYGSTAIAGIPIPNDTKTGELEGLVVRIARKMTELTDAYMRLDGASILSARQLTAEQIREQWLQHETKRSLIRAEQVFLQEQLDFIAYRLYGLIEADMTIADEKIASPQNVTPGARPFCIHTGKNEDGFEVPADIPGDWSGSVKVLWENRIEAIAKNRNLQLVESSMYKRRWIGRQGVFNHQRSSDSLTEAMTPWLLDRLESCFDFDGRMNEDDRPTAKIEIFLTSVAKLADIARQDEQFMEVAQVYRDDPAFDVQRLVEELVQSDHVPLLPILRYKPNGLRNRAEWEKTWELQRLEDKLRAGDAVNLDDYELTEKQRAAIAKWQEDTPPEKRADDRNLDAILAIPVPPKYKSSDFISSGGARYWSLRGKLDVPKERWVSFPHCEGPDGTLVIAWAGYNHLQLAQAISAYYVEVQERLGGRDDTRLIPLLAAVIELLPWLRQWHHDIDPEYNQRMDEVYEGFVSEEAKGLNLTIEEIKTWQPPKKTSKRSRARKA